MHSASDVTAQMNEDMAVNENRTKFDDEDPEIMQVQTLIFMGHGYPTLHLY